MTSPASSAFQRLGSPGQNMFCIWAACYAPPIGGAPARMFVGEWTGIPNGADLIVVDPDSGAQQILGYDNTTSTQYVCVDPYRPVIWLLNGKQLVELDRRTLESRAVCDLPIHYSMDVDRQQRIWFVQTRSLACFDPATKELTHYPDVTPDEYYYDEGTHMSHGVGPDGRIWTSQYPIACFAVFDPRTRTTKVVWGEPGKSFDPRVRETKENAARQPAKRVPGMPVAIGDLIWAGQLFADARTADLVEPPFPVEGPEAYTLLTRGAWCRTPTALLDRHGSALVQQQRRIGWLEVKSGRFELIGELPEDAPAAAGWQLHGDHVLIAGESQADKLIRVDLQAKKTTRIQLRGPYQHPQAMFDWTVGPDNNFYGSCYSHEMWQMDHVGAFKNHGDVVKIHGGELHGFTTWKNKLFIVSYTHSVLTRVDVTRPTGHWGKEPESNPRHILNLMLEHEGQHRPSAIDVTPAGHVYYLSRADYCARREGVLAVVDADTEKVLHIEDPLLPGEQLWSLAVSPTRKEAYIGTNRASFVVWDTEAMKIKRVIRFTPREGDGKMTSAMCEVGTIRFMGAVGDLVVGNLFGGAFEMFVYHADSGVMDLPKSHPRGKLFGIFPWKCRQSLLLFMNGALYEFDGAGTTKVVYPEPLPGFDTKEGPDGRLYISDRINIYGEVDPACQRLPVC